MICPSQAEDLYTYGQCINKTVLLVLKYVWLHNDFSETILISFYELRHVFRPNEQLCLMSCISEKGNESLIQKSHSNDF